MLQVLANTIDKDHSTLQPVLYSIKRNRARGRHHPKHGYQSKAATWLTTFSRLAGPHLRAALWLPTVMPWPSGLPPGVVSTVGYGVSTVPLGRRSPRRRDGCVESATARELPHSLAVSHPNKTSYQNQRATDSRPLPRPARSMPRRPPSLTRQFLSTRAA